MVPFVNIHTHLRQQQQSIQLLSLNTSEWVANARLKGELYTVGIHPYQSASSSIQQKLATLNEALQQPNVLALGEVGLDRSIDIPIEKQVAVLKEQLMLAKQYAKPVVFHAVRSIPDIISACKQEKLLQPLIFHGFIGKVEAVQQLQRANGYASFGAKLLTNRSWDEALKEAYELNALFLETDEADIPISYVYQKAAEVLNVEQELLKERVYAYFCCVFGTTYSNANK